MTTKYKKDLKKEMYGWGLDSRGFEYDYWVERRMNKELWLFVLFCKSCESPRPKVVEGPF